jgi:Protein of unknown function (DUF3306)
VYAAQEMTAMNDDGESFLGRWSKRKSQAQTGAKSEEPRSEAEESRQSGPQDAEPEEIALEDLPPIESIDASTDLSQWLRKRVPDAWRQAALKRVWATDPAISQFIGLAENTWDWNAPDGVPGFGPLSPTHDVTRLLAQVIGQLPENDAPEAGNADATTSDSPTLETSCSGPTEPNSPKEATDANLLDKSRMSDAPPVEGEAGSAAVEGQKLTRKRRGGGALPS